jgi:hypothetical protein
MSPAPLSPLIPAKAGTQAFSVWPGAERKNTWVPAFAGMSGFGERL